MLKIAIDAGHYKGTPGRRCLAALDPAQTGEWELNRRVADGLLAALVEVFGLTERKEVRERMRYTKRGGVHIVEVPVKDFGVRLVDKAKKSAYSGNYCNAGFFGNYNEGKDKFTLPVGHTVAGVETDNKWVNHYCAQRGKVSGGKLVYAEPGRTETTLFVRGGLADMGEVSAPPEGCAYAIAGVPVLRQGKAVSWSEARAQGWEASSLYATWHIFAGYGQDRSRVTVVALRTTTGNLISSGEGAKKLSALGLREAIKLDGGGSTILKVGGKTPVCTAGNRRICTVLTFGGNPYAAPTKALAKGNRGEGVRWLQWELNDRGFSCAVDGSFGPGTKEALMAYQVSAGLVPDGSCGPATRKALMG